MTDSAMRAQEMIAEEARRWIARMASGEMTGEELAAFKKWRAQADHHDKAFEEQRELWRALSAAEVAALPPARRSGRSWIRGAGRRLALPKIAVGTVAAALALFWAAPDLMLMLRADHRSNAAVERIALDDGSMVVLDAGSAISVDYSSSERRIALLRGDLWVQVAHGDARPFRVAALNGTTQDLGTAFAVLRQDDKVIVGVTEGAVRVETVDGGKPMTLHATQRAAYGKAGPVIRLANTPATDIASWRNGELLLHKAGVRETINAIGRYRPGQVFVLGDMTSKPRITAVFRTDRPDEALEAVCRMAGLQMYRIGNFVLLRPAQ